MELANLSIHKMWETSGMKGRKRGWNKSRMAKSIPIALLNFQFNPIQSKKMSIYILKVEIIKEGFWILFFGTAIKKKSLNFKKMRHFFEARQLHDSDYVTAVIYQSQTLIHSKCYVKTYKFEHNTPKLNVEQILLHWRCKREDIQI